MDKITVKITTKRKKEINLEMLTRKEAQEKLLLKAKRFFQKDIRHSAGLCDKKGLTCVVLDTLLEDIYQACYLDALSEWGNTVQNKKEMARDIATDYVEEVIASEISKTSLHELIHSIFPHNACGCDACNDGCIEEEIVESIVKQMIDPPSNIIEL